MECIYQAHAKINLGLLLIGKEKDGYHQIATVFQEVDLCDTLTFRKTSIPAIQIICTDPSIPLDEKNLIHRSFELYKNRLNIEGGIAVHVEKRIPSGGGLGGGSSNAAATLRCCELLWRQFTEEQILHRMAFEIGSDVPFFLLGGTALGLGRGEKLTPLDIPHDYWIALVFPGFPVSTAWAYQCSRIGLTNVDKISKLRALFSQNEIHTWYENLINELESVVFQKHPELHDIKMQLYKLDAFYASMSGSGSTLYGLFEDRACAEKAVQFFSKKQMKALLARPVPGHPPKK
jgi:4-diphosphocytidyl-2-C-methyl-D-erythritol kinase